MRYFLTDKVAALKPVELEREMDCEYMYTSSCLCSVQTAEKD